MYATDALNLKYSKQRSKSSVHTYQGGRQEISTQHADGSEGLFKSNGEFHPTNNPMDIEVKEYMNNTKNESKNMDKKLIRLTESDLHRIVKESVNKVLNELSTPMIVRAKNAALNAYNDKSGNKAANSAYRDKRMRQMAAFNDEYNRRTNNCTQLPSDMTQDEFDNARRNGWQ